MTPERIAELRRLYPNKHIYVDNGIIHDLLDEIERLTVQRDACRDALQHVWNSTVIDGEYVVEVSAALAMFKEPTDA
jgi:hypothetical protein